MGQLLFYGLVSGLFSLIGGLLLITNVRFTFKIMNFLLAFAAGAFLVVSFLDIIPEAVDSVLDTHNVFIAVLIGFTVFFAFERFLMKYLHRSHDHDHIHQDHTESLPVLLMVGDSLHNFMDGVLIALAYAANPALGLPTALGIAAHEVPQEIGDFSVLLDRGWSRSKVILVNILSSLFTLVGVGVGYYAVSFVEGWIPYLLGAVGGTFVYIAASDLIPEIHHRAGHKHFFSVMFFFILGLLVTGYLVFRTHA